MRRPPVSTKIAEGFIFLEPTELDGYLGYAIKIDRILAHKKTRFQQVHVVEAGPLGRVLFLDGSIQLSTADEAAYHEMLVHVPLLSHPDPRRVLIVGGGDGGSLREVLKHPGVVQADLCEIDGEVIEVCKKHLPELAGSFEDPRVRVHVDDGTEFVKRKSELYDVILVDSSDPEGAALALFGREFFHDLKRALRPGGLVVSQAESINFYAPLLEELFGFCSKLFKHSYYYLALVPAYLGGSIGFAFNSLGPAPRNGPDPLRLAELGELKYYTPALHRAAFALPAHYYGNFPKDMAQKQQQLWD